MKKRNYENSFPPGNSQFFVTYIAKKLIFPVVKLPTFVT